MLNPLDLVGSVTEFAKDIVDRFFPKKMTEGEKAAAALEIEKLMRARDDLLIGTQRDVIVAELQQDDKYTKRARPTIVYVGVVVMLFNYALVPFIAQVIHWVLVLGASSKAGEFANVAMIDMPELFWYVWGGACGVYAVGRTVDKVAEAKAKAKGG